MTLTCLSVSAGCSRREPPGAGALGAGALSENAPAGHTSDPEQGTATSQQGTAGVTSKAVERASAQPESQQAGNPLAQVEPLQLGTVSDNLPFEPSGLRLGSIALRTWIYSDTGPKRTRYGYLRAGSVVDARGPVIKNEGCPGGWYRVNPRGFVCVGMGATLDLNHPVVVAASVRPIRRQGLPYLYAKASKTPPFYYFRLPSTAQMTSAEGEGILNRAAAFRERSRGLGLKVEPPPPFLENGKKLEKPYGSKQGLHVSSHSGQAAPDSGFSFTRVIDWQNRWFGLTTELELIALDRTQIVVPSQFRGVELAANEGLPVGFVEPRFAPKYVLNAAGELVQKGAFGYREGLKLTGVERPGGMLEAVGSVWVPESILRKVPARSSFPSVATGDRKWIDISIRDQTLVAYVGRRPVYVTLVSTGRGGLGDPETTQSTVRGSFMIYQKDTSSTMDGDEDNAADSYALRDVPFVQYFHKGFALHGTYWHDEFGRVRSHGCVNLSPQDAAWLFEWTDPSVPADWHGVINKERGTVVFVRP